MTSLNCYQNEEDSGHVAEGQLVPGLLHLDLLTLGGVVPPFLLQICLKGKKFDVVSITNSF